MSGVTKALVVDRPAVGRRLGESSSNSNFQNIIDQRRQERDSAFRNHYEHKKEQQSGLKSCKTAPSLPTLAEELPKRKPRAYVKDKVKSRTKELMETIFAPLTRKSSEKKIRKTESQRTGLAIVAPSPNSTTDPIIIGRPIKGSTNWLSTAFGSSSEQRSLRKTASQTTPSDYNSVSQGNSEKSFKRRSILVDENGRLRLPFGGGGDRLTRPKSMNEGTTSSRSSIVSSFRLTGKVMETVKNGPFSNKLPAPKSKENTENQPEEKPKRSRSKLTLSLLSPLPPPSAPEPTSSEKRPLTTPTSPRSPIVSITAPTPPAVKKHPTMADILSSISPPPASLLQPPSPRRRSFRASTPRLVVPECQTTSANDYTTAEEEFGAPEEKEKIDEEAPNSPTEHPTFKKKPGVEQGSLADIVKRRPKRYVHSHTTSAYDPAIHAPDATERRRLIGFLHRTSHLSLTSELSADASFYLIGKFSN